MINSRVVLQRAVRCDARWQNTVQGMSVFVLASTEVKGGVCVCVLQKVGNENPNPNKALVMQSPGKIRACCFSSCET